MELDKTRTHFSYRLNKSGYICKAKIIGIMLFWS